MTTEQQTPSRSAPWVVATILALLVALLAVLLVRSYSVRDDDKRTAGTRLSAATTTQQAAVRAGAITAANLTTLSRKNYTADYARALAGTTGQLRKDLLGKKKAYLSAMTNGKFDLKASVLHSAYETQDDKGQVLVLVTINGARVVDGSPSSLATPQRFELTMVDSGGKWLVSDFQAINVQ